MRRKAEQFWRRLIPQASALALNHPFIHFLTVPTKFMRKIFFLSLLTASFFFQACNQDNNGGSGNSGANTTSSQDGGGNNNGGDAAVSAEGGNYVMPSEEVIKNKCAAAKPKTMKELSGGMKKLYYQLTKDNSASLNIFGAGNINLGKKELLVIVDFVQYKDTNCGGESLRYGVGARLFLHVKKLGKGIKTNDLPHLAAGVQLGQASITYSIETIGITGSKISDVMPGTGNFDVEAYAKVTKAVDDIQRLARDGQEGVVIDPQVIPVDAK